MTTELEDEEGGIGSRIRIECYLCGQTEWSEPARACGEIAIIWDPPPSWGRLSTPHSAEATARGIVPWEAICEECTLKSQQHARDAIANGKVPPVRWGDGMTLSDAYSAPPPEAEAYVPRLVAVRVKRERNERMGLRGRDGRRIYYPSGMSVWLPDDVFEAAFEPAPGIDRTVT